MKFVKRFINDILIFLTDGINTRRFYYDIRFERYRHPFFFRDIYDISLIFPNLRKFVDYRSNLSDYLRSIIDDNIVRYYMLKFQIDLSFNRFSYRNSVLNNNFKYRVS